MVTDSQLSQQLEDLRGDDTSAVVKSLASMADAVAEAIAREVTVLPVSIAMIFDAPNGGDLIRAYAAECLVPDAEPQRPMYEAMESARILHCWAAYLTEDIAPHLPTAPALPEPRALPPPIGFCSIITTVVPHDGHLVATTESIFVDSAYRHTSAFEDLFTAAEKYATAAGCRVLTSGARIGSALDKVLTRRIGFTRTHSQHTKWLGEFRPRFVEPDKGGQS